MKRIEEQKAYWLRKLSGQSGLVTLPADRERPIVSSFLREVVSRKIDPAVYAGGKTQAADVSTSPFAVLLAALKGVLYRYTGSTDIRVGSIIENAEENGTPSLVVIRTSLSGKDSAQTLIQQVALTVEEATAYSSCPFSMISEAVRQESSTEETLFHIAFEFSNLPYQPGGHGSIYADELARCDVFFRANEDPSGEVTLEAEYDSELFDGSTLDHFLQHWSTLLGGIVVHPESTLAELPLLSQNELQRLLVEWNDTKTDFRTDETIHRLFEAQVERTPNAVAVCFQDEKLTYRQLNARANQLAHRLRKLGVGPETLVGICADRSSEMMIGLLGILKAGGAYVPLDPNYPRERISFMLRDADVRVLLTQERLLADLPEHSAEVVCLDSAQSKGWDEPEVNPAAGSAAANLAYVIYTSGSTGKPKGVMITHRNVVNFFAGMDQDIGAGAGVWLAVTSISFDISVLELFWTLSRGFTVVIYKDENRPVTRVHGNGATKKKKVDFSLMYFASDEAQDVGNRYRLLLEGAKFADQHGFDAVWTPERHFHAFGGLYPNPSVTSAAVAAITERIKIRAGSVVLPLQNPIRVAEEWSVVDNLSGGRVAISFATGWQVNDFVLAPHNYANRKEVMLREIETVRMLWRGETLTLSGVDGKQVPVKTLPRPIQPDLPIWLTATGNPETCRIAGQLGANLLTHLVGQNVEDLAEKIAIYRKAWQEHGHAAAGRVTLMLHTFVGDDMETVRDTVREPFSNYLKTSVDLLKSSPWGFAPARLSAGAQVNNRSTAPASLTGDELSALVEHAFDRYFENSSLFGTPEVCLSMVDKLRAIGVDEIACLIDFGVDSQTVLDSLHLLNEVRERSNEDVEESTPSYSLASLAQEHRATHFQCTPSMAGMLMSQAENREWFARLRKMMIGGEAFPPALAKQLQESVRCSIHNMYGPTETTVWSATQTIGEVDGTVSIGRPIANTQIYLLDADFQPVPIGVAGELCIGGEGVVRGYLNRPELTTEKFVRNPFSHDPESRLYRTGDLARYRADGTIDFLGRMDQQVKIRGHRIELAEIETVLGQYESVRECAVVAREDSQDDKRVVAYIVLLPGVLRESKDLRNYLAAKLPDYMVPSRFVFLDRLPQTPNGKIDRRALPAPDVAQPADADRFVAPRTPLEEILAEIWAELLGVNRVGADDNFFELGGHSLMATQLITRLRAVFPIDLPLSVLFEAPTVSGLAAQMIAREPKPSIMERTALLLKEIDRMSEGEIVEKLQARNAD